MQLITTASPRWSTGTAAIATTLGMAALCWVPAVELMNQMGSMTRLGSLAFFTGMWLSMMAAMMLPAAVRAAARVAQVSVTWRAVPLFVLTYLSVWAVFGLAVYAFYRSPSSFAAGVVTIAAGLYEATPVKRYFRRRCLERANSGIQFGLRCVGSSIGLMAVLVVLGLMNVGWMIGIAVVVLAQKLLPPRAAIDVPVALAVVGLGILMLADPSSVPGFMPSM